MMENTSLPLKLTSYGRLHQQNIWPHFTYKYLHICTRLFHFLIITISRDLLMRAKS